MRRSSGQAQAAYTRCYQYRGVALIPNPGPVSGSGCWAEEGADLGTSFITLLPTFSSPLWILYDQRGPILLWLPFTMKRPFRSGMATIHFSLQWQCMGQKSLRTTSLFQNKTKPPPFFNNRIGKHENTHSPLRFCCAFPIHSFLWVSAPPLKRFPLALHYDFFLFRSQ